MNVAFLSGRITSDITRFGTDTKGGVSFTLVTSRPVIKDGQVQKGENGYTETYDQFHTVKAFGNLGTSVANHKKKGDKLIVNGEIRYSRTEKDGRTFYNTDIVADEIEFACKLTRAALTGRPLHFGRPDMLHVWNFDDVACIISAIVVTNPTMVDRIRRQALNQSDQEITAHLANAIANATDAAHAHDWAASNFGKAAPETQVDLEYYQDLASAWSLVAAERGIKALDA